MTLLKTLSSDLEAAAGRAADRRATRRRRLRLSGITVVGALAIGGVATAATGVWSPQVGDDRRGRPTISGSSVPQEQLDRFEVLRRPADDADRGVQTRYALKFLSPKFQGVRTDSVRLLEAGAPGDDVTGAEILVPVERRDGIDDALCLFTVDPADGGGVSCWSTAQILSGKAIGGMAKMDQPAPGSAEAKARAKAFRRAARRARARGETSVQMPFRDRTLEARISGLVPDGVARVVWTKGDRVESAEVRNNFFRVAIKRPDGAAAEPSTLTWFDAEDKSLKTVPGMF